MLPCWNLCYLQHNPSSPQIFLSFQILLLFIRHVRYPKAFKLWNLTPLIRTYSCFDCHMCISSLFPNGLIHCNFHFFHNWSSFLLFPELIDEHSLMQLNTPSLHCPMCHHNFAPRFPAFLVSWKTYQKSLKLEPSPFLESPQTSTSHIKVFNAALQNLSDSCYLTTCQNSLSSPLMFDSHTNNLIPLCQRWLCKSLHNTNFGPSLSSVKQLLQLITCISNTQETLKLNIFKHEITLFPPPIPTCIQNLNPN